MTKLGIIGAMAVEVETLKGHMEALSVVEKAGMAFYQGSLEGLPTVVVVCGVGKVNAALCVQILCDCFDVTHVVNTGVAGSLSAELDIGDFVISQDVIHHDMDCHSLRYPLGQVPGLPVLAFPADAALISYAKIAAETVYPGHSALGRIASGDQFVGEKAQKQAIIANTQALCTEMEGAAVGHAAWRNGVPFVVIRAISDKADDSAKMDYHTFEAIAAQRSAAVTLALAKQLRDAQK